MTSWMARFGILVALFGCMAGDSREGEQKPLVVFNAGSLARPLRAALDTFAAAEGIRVEQENAGSLETDRKLTELDKVPDVIALADHEVFSQLLMPAHTTWYVKFARNRMVIAYTEKSKFAGEISSANWWEVSPVPWKRTRSDPAFRFDVRVQRAEPGTGGLSLVAWKAGRSHLRVAVGESLLRAGARSTGTTGQSRSGVDFMDGSSRPNVASVEKSHYDRRTDRAAASGGRARRDQQFARRDQRFALRDQQSAAPDREGAPVNQDLALMTASCAPTDQQCASTAQQSALMDKHAAPACRNPASSASDIRRGVRDTARLDRQGADVAQELAQLDRDVAGADC